MSERRDLLVELFVEELPPKALKRLGEAFAEALTAGLKARRVATDESAVTAFATPRRLGVHVTSVAAKAGAVEEVRKLMAAGVARGADGPTQVRLFASDSQPSDFRILPSVGQAMRVR